MEKSQHRDRAAAVGISRRSDVLIELVGSSRPPQWFLFGPLPVAKLQVLILQLGSSLVGTLALAIEPWPRHAIEFDTVRLYIIRPGWCEGYLSTIDPS